MSNAIATQNAFSSLERVLVKGDLSTMTEEQRVMYYKSVCDTVGLNPLTRPLDFHNLKGKLVLYANKGAAEQLRMIHKISLKITAREKIDDVYVVTAEAHNAEGRSDGATGAVPLAGLRGEDLANAMMKAETKAKRRVTLSICGLNMLDEIEVDSVSNRVAPQDPGEGNGERGFADPNMIGYGQWKGQSYKWVLENIHFDRIAGYVTKQEEKKDLPPEGVEFVNNMAAHLAAQELGATIEPGPSPGDYVIPFGRKYLGKKLRDLPEDDVRGYISWLEEQAARKNQAVTPEVLNLKFAVNQYFSPESGAGG